MDVQNSINATFEDTTCLRDNETILKYPVYACSQVTVRSAIQRRVYIWLRAPIAAQRNVEHELLCAKELWYVARRGRVCC